MADCPLPLTRRAAAARFFEKEVVGSMVVLPGDRAVCEHSRQGSVRSEKLNEQPAPS